MFKIEVLVGRKFGMWLTGRIVYATREEAERVIRAINVGEVRADATPTYRRVVFS